MTYLDHVDLPALPPIMISAGEYDRLADLVNQAPPSLAAYFRRELARASIVADANFDSRAARIGSRVTYREGRAQNSRTVTLVWPHEVDTQRGHISVVTSIGAALLGLRPGNSIDWPSPLGGARRLTVLAVEGGEEPGPVAA